MSTVESQRTSELVYNLESNLAGDMLATGADNGCIVLYRIENDIPRPVQEISHGTAAIFSIAFTEERLIASTYDGNLLVWKLNQHEYSFEYSIAVFQGCINSIAIHKEDIVCGCSDGRIRIVSIAGGVAMECTAHKHGITGISSFKDYIITAGADGAVKIWSDTDLSLLLEINEHVMPIRDCRVCINEHGSFIFATCGEDGKVFIFSEKTDKPLEFIVDKHDIGYPCNKLSWSQTGYALAIGYEDNRIRLLAPCAPGKWEESSVVLP